jgi:D-lactate dehydrogenase (cytochrome)
VQENISYCKLIAKRHNAGDFIFATNEQEKASLWSARKEALWSMLALRKDGTEVWSTDVAVPLSRLPDIIGS